MARANKSKVTSEAFTKQRREERQQAKWERARKEREAIDQKLLEEAGVVLTKEVISDAGLALIAEQALHESEVNSPVSNPNVDTWAKSLDFFPSPVGPIELLSLPNSTSDLEQWAYNDTSASLETPLEGIIMNRAPSSPFEGLQSESQNYVKTNSHDITNGHLQMRNGIGQDAVRPYKEESSIINEFLPNGLSELLEEPVNGTNAVIHDDVIHGSEQPDNTVHTSSNFASNGPGLMNGTCVSAGRPRARSQKSVRFSPNVEETTFVESEAPSPDQGVAPPTSTFIDVKEEHVIQEKEHFQLMMEEAFFLAYGLGALTIFDPINGSPIPNHDLLDLFRKSSHFPPLANPVLSPDDPFLLNYVVYHHYRSLGWCVRGGAKFSSDFMLYNRGPVFSHAEFAVLIVPSYTDPYWSSDPFLQNYVQAKERRSWSSLHCINRVISQVKKKLVLVYVDVPKPTDAGVAEKKLGIDEVLGKYKVREFVMRRWMSNRERK